MREDLNNLIEQLAKLGYPICVISSYDSYDKRHYSVWAHGGGKRAIRGQSSAGLDIALKDIVDEVQAKRKKL